VFDAKVTLFENTPEVKAADINAVDVKVEATMGRIKLVFLMKFVNDFLKFLEPFSGAKDMVAERANSALEDATKSMIDAYANSTRAMLDIKMDAPVIIIPVHSRHGSTLIADLGTLTLSNRFVVFPMFSHTGRPGYSKIV
jgi:vacuolar protein sorting-associated protein 13A/C